MVSLSLKKGMSTFLMEKNGRQQDSYENLRQQSQHSTKMNEQRSLTNQQQQQFKRPNDGNFNYMTEDQLTEYLNGIGGSISKPEIERMYLSRRRLSIELKKRETCGKGT